jgi:hypothetical protein
MTGDARRRDGGFYFHGRSGPALFEETGMASRRAQERIETMPQLGPASDSLTAAAAPPDLEKLKRYFTEARQLTEQARLKSLQCQDYYDSDQIAPRELALLEERRQPPIVVNRIKPAINGIVGVAERGRTDPRAWPRNPQNTDQADTATDILRYVADFNRFKSVKRDCFLDMLICGAMAVLVGADADKNVTITQVRWEEFFGDPRSRRRDYKDARFLGIAKWMYADDAAALWPEKQAAIEATVETGTGGGVMPDQSYQDRPMQGSATGGAWVDRRQRRLMVVEMYYREGTWKRAVFTVTDVLEAGASPYTDHKGNADCPIEAMSAYVRRDNMRYGAVWDMIPVQDEINKRRSKALHHLMASRVQLKDPIGNAADRDHVRAEAARPDGVIPPGWEMSPSVAEFQGNVELLAEAKSEMERMAPNPAVLGRDGQDASGRALMARQQAGLIELAPIYGALEDWELRVYRQCWGRVKQFWRAPQFIRVTDDEDAPKFVGLNQPILGAPSFEPDPETGLPDLRPGVLGYRNAVGEMDVDIEIDATPDLGTIAQEQFNEIVRLVGASPIYQQQVSITQLIALSTLPHKRSLIDQIQKAEEAGEARAAQAQQLQAAHLTARTHEAGASAIDHVASGQARVMNALTEAHALHADHAAAGFEAGVASGQRARPPQDLPNAPDQGAPQPPPAAGVQPGV